MNLYMPKNITVLFVLLLFLPCHALAASITETTAAIGLNCIASGQYSTAMGFYTEASGYASTTMGVRNTAAAFCSFAGGQWMQVEVSANNTFAWGYAKNPVSITTSDVFLIFPSEDAAGKVGIGTPAPMTKLDIQGETDAVVLSRINQIGNRSWSGWRLDRNGSEKWFIGLGTVNDNLLFRRTASSNDMVISEAGNVGIGRVPTTYKLEVAGDALKTAGGSSWQTSSDERLKNVTGEYTLGLNNIFRLRPVTFHYKEDNPRGLPSDEEYIGFVAQEVQEVFPEAVSEGPDGYLDFNMHPVSVALVNAVKELKAENEALREEIRQIKAALGTTSRVNERNE